MAGQIKIAIRADAGHALGTGHFGRTAPVAKALQLHPGVEVMLLTAEGSLPFVSSYFPETLRIEAFEAQACTPGPLLDELARRNAVPDVLYLDHYGEVREWEASVAGRGIALAVLDDLLSARTADAIIRPVPRPGGEPLGRVYAGPAYLPLSDHVLRARERASSRSRPDHGTRINVCFGGSDPTGETRKALDALAGIADLQADVIVGPGSSLSASDLERFAARPDIEIHRAPSQEALARLMSEADIALGAGGVTQWERLCIGVPSLVVTVADNQLDQVRWMEAEGVIRCVGDSGIATPDAIRAALVHSRWDGTFHAMAEKGRALVDGRGAVRLAGLLRSLVLSTREAGPADGESVFAWRIDDRNWSYNWSDAEKPDLHSHLTWFAGKRADPACTFLIVEDRSEPVGVVRFDESGGAARLSIYLVPDRQGQRLGLPVYFAAERALRQVRPSVTRIDSRIHRDNRGSTSLHRDAGFSIAPSPSEADWLIAGKSF